MIEIEKMYALTTKNLRNFGAHQIIELFSVLRSAHMVSSNQNQLVFYVNYYMH